MSEAVDTGSTGPGNGDYVPITDATDEDIKAFLNTPEDDDGNLLAEEDTESDPEKSKKKKQPQKLPPEKKEAKEEEEAEKPVDKKKEKPKAEAAKKEESKKEEPKKSESEDLAKLQAQLAQKEAFIKRQSNELGLLRKKELERQAQLDEQAELAHAENPREAYRIERELEDSRRKVQEIDSHEQSLHNRVRAEQVLAANLAKDDWDIDAVVDMLKREGRSEELIANFRKDPISTGEPELLIQAFKRARAEKTIQQIVPAANALLEQYGALEKENESLKAQLKRAGVNVLDKVQSTLKQQPTLTAARGSSSAKRDLSSFNPTTMTREELKAFLQEPD